MGRAIIIHYNFNRCSLPRKTIWEIQSSVTQSIHRNCAVYRQILWRHRYDYNSVHYLPTVQTYIGTLALEYNACTRLNDCIAYQIVLGFCNSTHRQRDRRTWVVCFLVLQNLFRSLFDRLFCQWPLLIREYI